MRELELPPGLAYQLERAAEQAGLAPEELATVVLNLALALWGEGRPTAFGSAVQRFLRERSVPPEPLAAVFGELVERCLAAPRAGGEEEEGGGLSAWREEYSPRPYVTTGGVNVIKEQPMHAYGAPAPAAAPLARASALGRYAHLRSGSEEFARAKEAEIAREDRARR